MAKKQRSPSPQKRRRAKRAKQTPRTFDDVTSKGGDVTQAILVRCVDIEAAATLAPLVFEAQCSLNFVAVSDKYIVIDYRKSVNFPARLKEIDNPDVDVINCGRSGLRKITKDLEWDKLYKPDPSESVVDEPAPVMPTTFDDVQPIRCDTTSTILIQCDTTQIARTFAPMVYESHGDINYVGLSGYVIIIDYTKTTSFSRRKQDLLYPGTVCINAGRGQLKHLISHVKWDSVWGECQQRVCAVEVCNNPAVRKFCPIHAINNCRCGSAKPHYGHTTDETPSCCHRCKKPGMIDITRLVCTCGRTEPTYGIPGEDPTCCSKCRQPGMEDLVHSKCICGLCIPSFGHPGDERASCCASCKQDSMENIVSRKCMCGLTQPRFGYPDDDSPSCCSKCKENGMENIVAKKCICGLAQPHFGYPDDNSPTCCSKCKQDGMDDIVSRKCMCGLAYPKFGYPADKTRTCCSKCKKDGMENMSRKCACGLTQPHFGYPDDNSPTCCSKCKQDGMEDIVSRKCVCGLAHPTFGYPDDPRPTCCSKCKEDDMEDIKSRKCLCGMAQPHFGYAGDSQPECCSKCKQDGMEDIVARKCICGLAYPHFGYPGDKSPTCCSKCKEDGMENISTRKCMCGSAQPSFGYPNDPRPTCCSKCKEDGMENIKSKKCLCGSAQPHYGYPEDPCPTCCSKCKDDGMENISPSRKCVCGLTQPTFGYAEDESPTCCSKCKQDNMENIVSKKCICGLAHPSFGYPDDKIRTCCSKCKQDGMENVVSRKCVCGSAQPNFGYPDDKAPTFCSKCKADGMINLNESLCEMECCITMKNDTPCRAIGKHPTTGQRVCTFAARNIVSDAPATEQEELNRHFGFKKTLVMRGEHAFYHKLCLAVPELALSERALDESVLEKCMGKTKTCSDPRPDYFHLFRNGDMGLALHGEYDETLEHEDCDERLSAIADASGCGYNNVYVFRVQAHHYTSRAVCTRRVVNKHHTYYCVTDEGMRVVHETAEIIRQRLEWISQGLAPDDDAGRPRKVFINF